MLPRPPLESVDMFEETTYDSPYRLSQEGAGYNTQMAFAMSVSEV